MPIEGSQEKNFPEHSFPLLNYKNLCFPRSEIIHSQTILNHNIDTFGTFPYAKHCKTGKFQKKRQRKERNGGLNLASQASEGCLLSVLRCLYIKCSYLLFFSIFLKLLISNYIFLFSFRNENIKLQTILLSIKM